MRARALGHLPGGIPARVVAKDEAVDLTPAQRERFAGTSVKKDDKGYYCHTHRARSDSYPSVDEIPDKDVTFIESTGSRQMTIDGIPLATMAVEVPVAPFEPGTGIYRFEQNTAGWRKTADDDQCPYCSDGGLAIGGGRYRCQGCGRTFDLGQREAEGTLKTAEADTAGVMVCLIPEEHATMALMEAADSTEEFDEQHITLLYLGSVEEAGGDAGRERLHRAVYDFAIHSGHDVLDGRANGWGTFNNVNETTGQPETVLVALWDIPGIAEFRAALKAALTDHGVPMREENHGFTPHQTMRYEDGTLTALPRPVLPAPESVFTHVVISWGDEWSSVALEGALDQTQQQVAATLKTALDPGSRWDESRHPRGGNPKNPGQFSRGRGGPRGTVVPDSKRPQRPRRQDGGQQAPQQQPQQPQSAPSTPTAPTPADMPQQRQQAPQGIKVDPAALAQHYGKPTSWRPPNEKRGKPSRYAGTSDEVFWSQVAKGDVYGMHIQAGEFPVDDPRNEPEYKARAEKVESLAGLKGKYAVLSREEAKASPTGGATDALYDRMHNPVTGKDDVWEPERAALHKKIISEFVSRVTKGVPKEGKCLVMAGPSGAGKSTFLKMQGAALGVQLDADGNPVNFATINPDDFKNDIPVDMTRYPGVGENETAILKHEESSHLAKLATAELMAQGFNVIMDVTLGSASSAQKKYVDADYAQGYHDYTVALVDGDMANSRQNAGNRWKQPNPQTGQRSFAGRFIPMDLVEAQAPTEAGFRSINAQEFMKFAALPRVSRAVVFDPYDTKRGLQEAKSAIHEAIRRNSRLAGILRAEGRDQQVPTNTAIGAKIAAYKAGQVSEDELVRFLTQEAKYTDPGKCPFPKNTPQWYHWHENERLYVPGSFDEVRLANIRDDIPDNVYRRVTQILWDGAQSAE